MAANNLSNAAAHKLRRLLFTIYQVPSMNDLQQEECIHVQLLPDSERCSFVEQAPDCLTESSFVPYLRLLFCEFDSSSRYLGVLICVVWLVLMFYLLGKSANDFFCPALTVIARVLGLSENLAGVTVLAFGNGSPDIFTSLVGAPRGRSQLVFGELIGSGLFVTSVIAGSICTLEPFQLMERPFLRDVIFYLGAVYWTFYIFYKGVVTTWEAVGFILLYVVYIAVVLAERMLSKPSPPAGSSFGLDTSKFFMSGFDAGPVAEDDVPWKSSMSTRASSTSDVSRASGTSLRGDSTADSLEASSRSLRGTPLLQQVSPVHSSPSLLSRSSPANSLEASSRSLPETPIMMTDEDERPTPRRTRSQTVSTVQELAIHHERLQQLWVQGLQEELRREKQLEEDATVSSSSLDLAQHGDESTPLLAGVSHRGTKHRLWRELRAGLAVALPWQNEDAGWLSHLLAFLQLPVVLVLKLLVPVVNYTVPRHAWCRTLNALHCVTCPLFCVFATQVAGVMIAPYFPLWLLTTLLGGTAAVFVLLTSRHDRPPKYHAAFAFLGFAGSVVTIYMVANEVVNLLRAIGILSRMSDTILGMTVLAWGNSIGDFITNFSIARQGFERMGFSACYGGPLFNILLGIGISFTMATVASGEHRIYIQYGEVGPLLAFFLGLSLLSSLLAFPLMKFTARRTYGFYLLGLYCVFLISATFLEVGWFPSALMPAQPTTTTVRNPT